ncbi:L-lactate permease [Haladaptatus sp. AB643]|uniref:L-lactate permease n=1 Tax=Haladaptatus sp. AB643 TaxID=2934174 RepID=UPI00209C306A|nr:L-lactate permease [Haladaptatus sp. AB643]MCO8244853.1 L-lactate permease [Haladaptatus sp. AB643]
MPPITSIVLALVPLMIITYLMVIRFWPATRAMPVAWVVALAVGYLGWGMSPRWLAGATINGFITALSILWIVFGAILLLYTLKETGAFDVINRGFASISDDRRVQVVVLVFLMCSFMEGAAGFGTPAAVVGPLLVGLGFPPLAAVVIALTGNLMAITFGAVGTPLVIGMQDTLESVSMVKTQVVVNGPFGSISLWVDQIAVWAATYHAIVGIAVPIMGVMMMTRFFGEERSIRPAFAVLPLALFSWVTFVIPYWLTAYYLGPEFPALLGSMVAMVLTIGALKAGYFHPDDDWEFAPRDTWPSHWVGGIEPGESVGQGGQIAADGGTVTSSNTALADDDGMSIWMAWLPYGLLAVLLVLTRVWAPLTDFLQSTLVLQWNNILGTGLDNSISVLYLPGAVFVFVHFTAVLLHRLGNLGRIPTDIKNSWAETFERIAPPLVALLFAVGTVQIMLQSGAATGGDSMLIVLSKAVAGVAGGTYPFFAAFVGAFGAFLAGSNTVSDILFGTFQFGVARDIGVSRTLLLAAQAVGGAIGNLIAIHNVVAALAVVGLVGEEGRVIRLELIPLIYYGVFTGILSLLFVYVLFPGVF